MKKSALIILFLSSLCTNVFACAVCYGAADDPMTKGMDMAILFLLGTIGTILMGIIAFTIYFVRRSRLINN